MNKQKIHFILLNLVLITILMHQLKKTTYNVEFTWTYCWKIDWTSNCKEHYDTSSWFSYFDHNNKAPNYMLLMLLNCL